MKKIFLSTMLLFSVMAYSQVIISDQTGTATDKTSVLLDFANTGDRGIILPYNRTLPTGTGLEGGTIILDATNAAKAKVKVYAPGNANADTDNWLDLSSGNEANINTQLSIQPLSTGPNAVVEDTAAKAIIGSPTTTAKGVLILESTNKAMVLPQVATTDAVINPAPGMMVYVNKAGFERLAVFNGAKWTYWKY